MKLNIRGKDMKITEAMKNYADEKFTKLEKYLKDGEDIKAKLLFKIDGINQKLEVTIPLKNITNSMTKAAMGRQKTIFRPTEGAEYSKRFIEFLLIRCLT